MTPEAQQFAIAKFRGLKPRIITYNEGTATALVSGAKSSIPDYLSDLNACHEMEQSLTPNQFWAYYERIIGDFDLYEGEANPMIIHATAGHRCEAFLKTLDLWTS